MLSELENVATAAMTDATRLAEAVRESLAEIRVSLVGQDPTKLHELIEGFVGPMILLPDGTVAQKDVAPEGKPSGASDTRLVAGAGFEPATFGL